MTSPSPSTTCLSQALPASSVTKSDPTHRVSRRLGKMRALRVTAGAMMVAVAGTVLLTVTAHADTAATTVCQSRVEEQWIGATSQYRVVASCSSIAADTEIRGVLDAPLYPDKYTPWFSIPNEVHTSPWAVSPFASPESRTETRPTN